MDVKFNTGLLKRKKSTFRAPDQERRSIKEESSSANNSVNLLMDADILSKGDETQYEKPIKSKKKVQLAKLQSTDDLAQKLGGNGHNFMKGNKAVRHEKRNKVAVPPRSLSDSEYLDIFKCVLQAGLETREDNGLQALSEVGHEDYLCNKDLDDKEKLSEDVDTVNNFPGLESQEHADEQKDTDASSSDDIHIKQENSIEEINHNGLEDGDDFMGDEIVDEWNDM